MSQQLPLRSASENDREGRRLAQTEFERPLILEAGAGTGKTTTLVARIVSWCLGPGWHEAAVVTENGDGDEHHVAGEVLRGVVAITFTENGAAEMAKKVAEAIAILARDSDSKPTGFDLSVFSPTPLPEIHRRARILLGALDELSVQTIHAFCRGLLMAYPLDARLHPELVVDADGERQHEIVRDVVEERVRSAYASGVKHDLSRLGTRGLGPSSIAAVLGELVRRGVPAAALARDPFDEAQTGKLKDRLVELLDRFHDAEGGKLRGVGRRLLAKTVVEAVEASRTAVESSGSSIEELYNLVGALRRLWSERLLKRLRDWGRRDFNQTELRALEERSDQVMAAASPLRRFLRHVLRLDPLLFQQARLALQPLLKDVERRLQAAGVATFQALLVEARDLLASRRQVRRRERRRIRQLLVDEFQDTDHIQCDLIRMLALQGDASERPGLFVVGDPKQSIYGWRNADLAAYEEFVGEALAAGGVRSSLNRNFRSAPPILEEVERAVEPVMAREAGLQPHFQSLMANRQESTGFSRGRWAPIEYWVSWLPSVGADAAGAGTSADAVAQLEARALAQDLVALHESEAVEWRDIGVLLRSMHRLEIILGALREAGVPFAVTSDKHYYRRREVIEAAALVRAVLNPLDHLALLTTLRAASVGVPDAALIPLWQEGFPQEMSELTGPEKERLERIRRLVRTAVRNLPEDIPGLERIRGWELNLLRAVENLALLRASYANQPSDLFIEQLRQLWLLETTEAARYLGPYRLANLDRFFRRLEEALEDRGGDMAAILRTLRRSVAEAQEAEEARPREAAVNAVQVLTIHKAKGLEFRHVYLMQLHAETRDSALPVVDIDERWRPSDRLEYSLFGAPTPDFDRVEARRRRVAAAERVRTLYVAMTRAQDRLVLVGNWPETPKPCTPDTAASHLDLLQQRRELPDSLADLRDRCVGEATGRRDEHSARWRFLAHPAPQDPAPSVAAETSARLPSPSEIESSASRLKRLRSDARLRMARPLVAAASARLGELHGDRRTLEATTVGRDLALQVGSAIHRMLESWRLDTEPSEELARQRRLLLDGLENGLPADLAPKAQQYAERILHKLASGSLLARLATLGPAVMGREVPVLLANDPDEPGALACTVGAIDLIYRDEQTGLPVIVDYKTDELPDAAAIDRRAQAYLPQIGVYQQAVQGALGLADPPAAELWFLQADRVWRTS